MNMKFGGGGERGGPMKDRKSEGFGEDCAVCDLACAAEA